MRIQDCDAAIQRDPKEFAAWFNRGNVEARLQQYGQALDSYRKAADLAPGIAGVHGSLDSEHMTQACFNAETRCSCLVMERQSHVVCLQTCMHENLRGTYFSDQLAIGMTQFTCVACAPA